jgi:glycosidase
MDTYPYPDMYFMSDWTKAVMKEYPKFNIVGEEWNLEPTVVSYWQAGKQNANGYTSALKSVMDFPLQNAFVTALNENNTWNSSWNTVYDMLGQDYLYPDPMNLLIFPDNHDMSRIHAQLENDIAKTKIAIAYFATTRGIPQFYYGTEILMADTTGSHGEIRSDFPGGWDGDEVSVIDSKGLSTEQLNFLNYMKTVLNWRKTSSVTHTGKTKHFAPKRNDLYVYLRYDENDVVMVILNKNKKEVTLETERYLPHLLGKTKAREIISDKKLDLTETIKIPGMSAYILDFD